MESSRSEDVDAVRSKVASLCATLGACAGGYWRLDQESARLELIVFVAGAKLDPEVGRAFTNETQVVHLNQRSLGIVVAAISGRPAVSRVTELPADSGSGGWLRAFGASRSVAVPERDERDEIKGILSVALPRGSTLSDDAVIGRIRDAL